MDASVVPRERMCHDGVADTMALTHRTASDARRDATGCAVGIDVVALALTAETEGHAAWPRIALHRHRRPCVGAFSTPAFRRCLRSIRATPWYWSASRVVPR